MGLAMFVIEFKLHPQLDFWRDFLSDTVLDNAAFPVDAVKEYVIGEIFGLDKTVSAFFLNVHDLAESSPLNAKLLLDPIFLVGVIHDVTLAAGLVELAGISVREATFAVSRWISSVRTACLTLP